MSKTKDFIMKVSEDMGYGGEITEEVMAEARDRWKNQDNLINSPKSQEIREAVLDLLLVVARNVYGHQKGKEALTEKTKLAAQSYVDSAYLDDYRWMIVERKEAPNGSSLPKEQ